MRYNGLFVTDLDGTLLSDDKKIAAAELKALRGLRDIGVLTAIATGRSNYSFDKLISQLGHSGSDITLAVDYIIVSTGAGLMTFPEGRIIKSFALRNDDVQFIAEYLERRSLDYMIHKPLPDTKHFLYSAHGEENPDFYARLEIYKDFSMQLTQSTLETFGEATEVVCIVPAEKGHDLAEIIRKDLQQFSVIKATSPLDGESIWIEIFPADVSKSQTTQLLADSLNICHKDICAVGNDFNDEDLLRWVECGYVVSNGPSSMKDSLHVVGSNNEGGVSEAIEHWRENTLLL